MPIVNVFLKDGRVIQKVQDRIPELKAYLADALTCGDIKLTPGEISIRILTTVGGDMIAPVEVEITAHAFSERVQKQDEICLEVMKYLKDRISEVGDVKVWLKLSELGHSW